MESVVPAERYQIFLFDLVIDKMVGLLTFGGIEVIE